MEEIKVMCTCVVIKLLSCERGGGVRIDLICRVYTTSEYRCCLCTDCLVLVTGPLKTALCGSI